MEKGFIGFAAEDFETRDTECFLCEPGDATLIASIANAKLHSLFEAWIATLPLYNYCEDCKEWVAPGVTVCNYRGKTASFIERTKGWDEQS